MENLKIPLNFPTMMPEYSHESEEIKELLREYENLCQGKSHSFLEEDAFQQIIDYFDAKDDFSHALEATETGLEYFPYSSELLLKKADLLLVTRSYHKALETLELASLLDNKNINLYILKTDAYLALDEAGKAIALLEEALQLFEGDEERINLLFELCDVYDDYEEFDKVFECLQLILEEDKNNEEALYKICFWTEFTGRNEESIRLHQSILEEYPYNELAWFNLGSAYQGLKLYEKAIDAYKYAIAIDEKFDYAYRNMGDAFIRLRQYKEAIEALEKVLECNRPEEVIYEAIGHCYYCLKNYAQARFYFRKASHLNPSFARLHYKIAQTYMKEQQWQAAIKQLEHALQSQRHIPEYYLAMGECKTKTGQFKEAIHFLSVAVKLRPHSKAAWETLIRCLYERSFFSEALEQSIAALEATQKPVFYFYRAAMLFALQQKKQALSFLEKGMDTAPRQVKKIIDIMPSILQHTEVVDLLATYKKKRKI